MTCLSMINYIKNLQGDFKPQFKDLLNMEIPEWIIFPFDVEWKVQIETSFLKKNVFK